MFNLNSKTFKFAQALYHKHLAALPFGPILSKAFWFIYSQMQRIIKYINRRRYISYEMRWQTNSDIMNDCIVTGGSRFLFQGGNCYVNAVTTTFDLAQIFQEYYFQEELISNFIYDPILQQIARPRTKVNIILDGCWLSLLSTSSTTWMHLLSEYIPVVANVQNTHTNLDFGILYEENLPAQGLECLKILAGNRRIKAIAHNQNVQVKKLVIPQENSSILISVWPRTKIIGTGYYAYDSDSLLKVRTKLLEHFNIIPNKQRNIFVDRESKFRFIDNNSELQTFLDKKGFSQIFPGKLSLAEQVAAFSQANLIIIQAGSALANIMFMPRGSKVICMCAKSAWANYAYFIDYAKIFGVELMYLEGSIVDQDKYSMSKPCTTQHPMNANFHISLQDLNDMLLQLTETA